MTGSATKPESNIVGAIYPFPLNIEAAAIGFESTHYGCIIKSSVILPPTQREVSVSPEYTASPANTYKIKISCPRLSWTQTLEARTSYSHKYCLCSECGSTYDSFKIANRFVIKALSNTSFFNGQDYILSNVQSGGNVCWGWIEKANPAGMPKTLAQANALFWLAPFNYNLIAKGWFENHQRCLPLDRKHQPHIKSCKSQVCAKFVKNGKCQCPCCAGTCQCECYCKCCTNSCYCFNGQTISLPRGGYGYSTCAFCKDKPPLLGRYLSEISEQYISPETRELRDIKDTLLTKGTNKFASVPVDGFFISQHSSMLTGEHFSHKENKLVYLFATRKNNVWELHNGDGKAINVLQPTQVVVL